MRTSHLRSALALGVSMAALAGTAPAWAQAANPPPPNSQAPTSASAAPAPTPAQQARPTGGQQGGGIQEVVVTAQRRSEAIQDVPVAVSAFSDANLKAQRLDGGQNLELSIPNVNYSRGNFGGYNFQIRGVGTKVVGEGGTAGVSFNVNELPLAANHFGDTDFYDVERVEVLRGPQGTLYGRNSTGGAVNVITAKPTDVPGASLTGEYGNYNSIKLNGFINAPINDVWSARVAGFYLKRDGFGTNIVTGDDVDSRDLYSVRGTLAFRPNERFNAYLMAEHYEEKDSRNRVGKQLCIKDPTKTELAGLPLSASNAAFLNQGCIPGSLYQPAAYGTVNSNGTLGGVLANLTGLNSYNDVFANHPLQDSNLHDIESAFDPIYEAKETLIDLHMNYDLTDHLSLQSTTGYNRNTGYSFEDYNRITPTTPFNATPNPNSYIGGLVGPAYPFIYGALFPGGVVSDPQVGNSNLYRNFDYGTTSSTEFTQEIRLSSSFNGPLNFAAGALYSDIRYQTNYDVISNGLTQYAEVDDALGGALTGGQPIDIDPNFPPDGTGHNYYDSRDNIRIHSTGFFGEVYYQLTDTLKFTGGARYSTDRMDNTAFPVTLLTAGAGFPGAGTPTEPYQNTAFKAWTGRANIDWTPHLSFTNQTLIYATYSRGYKGGGFNTPCQNSDVSSASTNSCGYPDVYAPETIDAFEVGTKNTLLNGNLVLNADAFYYNYTGYQVSKIVNESSVNENIDAKIYGVEFESVWIPIHNLTLNTNVGYLHTAITGGESIDELNLTQGNAGLTVVKGSNGSNCVVNTAAMANFLAVQEGLPGAPNVAGVTGNPGAILGACSGALAPFGLYNYTGMNVTTQATPQADGSVVNVGQGVNATLKNNQLPNSPEFTVSFGAQYVYELPDDWRATLRGDYYWQDNSYARIYNAVNDYLKSWSNVNATLTFDQPRLKVNVQFFVKNLFDKQPITDTYVTDPTSGLFTNTFTLDPRTYGISVTKRF